MGGVIIDPNLKKQSVRIDTNGNVIDPRTKQIIQEAQPEFVPPVEAVGFPQPETSSAAVQQYNTCSIKEQIIQTEKHLADLKVQRKEEIAKLKAELEELENE